MSLTRSDLRLKVDIILSESLQDVEPGLVHDLGLSQNVLEVPNVEDGVRIRECLLGIIVDFHEQGIDTTGGCCANKTGYELPLTT